MIIIYTANVICFLWMVWWLYDGVTCWFESGPLENLAGSWFVGLLIGCAVWFIAGCTFGNSPAENYIYSQQPIHSLVDRFDRTGNFFLGCGGVGEGMKYYYIVEDEFGDRVSSMDASKVALKYVDTAPTLKIYRKRFVDEKLNKYIGYPPQDYYVMEVPKNTVKKQYNVDFK